MIRPLVVGNWKMNLDHVEAIHLVQQIGVLLRTRDHDRVDVFVAPPFIDVRSVTSVIDADRLPIGVAAQHVSAFDRGAYTGEIAAGMLTRLGVRAVIVGHSERRTMYAMDDASVAATFAAAQRANLLPIVCVGETEVVRASGSERRYVADQVFAALAGATERPFAVAYEPLWAIGTGVAASASQVADMASVVRESLPTAHRDTTPILYGGSVKADTVHQLARATDINGFLVGGASLDASDFVAIVGATHDCYGGNR